MQQLNSTQKKYLFATLIAILILVINQVFIQYWLHQKNKDACLINIAGRQRMLSQKLSVEFYQLKERKVKFNVVKETFKEWYATHKGFLNGSKKVPRIEDKEIHQLLKKSTSNFLFIENILKKKAIIDKNLLEQISTNQVEFLECMEKTVMLLEEKSDNKLEFIVIMEVILALISILIIILEVVFVFTPISKRLQKTVEQIKSSKNKLRAILDSTSDSNILIDENFKIVEFNKVAYRLTKNLSSKKMQIAQDIEEYIPKSIFKEVENHIKTALNGQKVSLEKELHFDNNTSLWFAINYLPVYDEKKEIIGVSLNYSNIDEKKRAALTVEQSNKKYTHLVNTVDGIVWEADADPVAFTFVSKQAEEMLGYPTSSWLGNSSFWVSLIHPDDKDYAITFCDVQTQKGKDHQFEYRMKKSDGTYIWIRDLVRVQKDGNEVAKLYGLMIDITEQKQIEEALKKSESKYRLLYKNTPVMLHSIDSEGHILDTSNEWLNVLGYQDKEVIGKKSTYFLTEESQKYAKEVVLPDFFRIGACQDIPYKVRKKNGETIDVLLSAISEKDDKENIIRSLAVMTNITERVKAENSLKESEEKTKRLLKITQNQNKRLLNFAHIISHNLRSHVANQIMLISLIQEEHIQSTENEYFPLLQKATNNLEETLQHLNEVVNINNNDKIILERLNLLEYTEKAIINLKAKVIKGKSFIKNQITKQTFVKANSAYLDSILLNILSNAIKYKSSKREGLIVISSEIKKNFVILSIKDNGLGIDLEKYGEKIFGMYKTFHKNRDARGIGLFITKNQIEAMGGRVEVESKVNEGTIFKIYLQNGTV